MSIVWIVLTASLLLAPAPARADEIPACGVELQLRPKAPVAEVQHHMVDSWSAFEAELVNTGDRPVTLVMPGDGSAKAWRTPALHWSVSPEPETPQLMFCGNINSLHPGDVFTLAPGERRQLNRWVPPIYGLFKSGTYTFRLSYINDPALKWKGEPLGQHDPGEMQRVRESTPCAALSNEVTVTVVSKQ